MDIQLGSSGVTLFVTIRNEDRISINLSQATVKQIILVSPSGAINPKDASFVTDGANGELKYVTVNGDLNIAGEWKIYAYIVTPEISGNTSQLSFTVVGNL
jgi:hypothetical protein